MDTARFDALARRLGGNVTRRGALSVLASLVAIGAGEAAGKDRHRRTGHHRARGGVTAQITDGVLDGNGHPYVGLMVAQDAKGKPLWRCSGTLLSSQLFLTAGHCTEAPAAHVEIWFQADVESGRADAIDKLGKLSALVGATETYGGVSASLLERPTRSVANLDAHAEAPAVVTAQAEREVAELHDFPGLVRESELLANPVAALRMPVGIETGGRRADQSRQRRPRSLACRRD